MLALPRGGTLRADYSLIAIYLSICAAESQYAGKIVALCKPKSRYGNGGTGCPVCPNRAGGSPCPGGKFCHRLRRGLPLRAAGAQEGRQPAVFHPLVNLPFSLWDSTAKFAELRLTKERQSGYSFVPFSAFSQFTDNILIHMRATLRWARHNRVAQLFYALFQTTPAQIDYTKPINPQVLSIYSRLTTCAALSCRACAD